MLCRLEVPRAYFQLKFSYHFQCEVVRVI
uniref:Uncharacterized protein n=1 Tax=Arundo donax TaxID=35708 RepID=A0A0A8YLX0_ARUDO